MYYPAGQKFARSRSISYGFRDIQVKSDLLKRKTIKVAITQLAMDLQL